MKDKRITPAAKAAPSLNIPYYSPAKKIKKGVNLYLHMMKKEPNVGKFPAKKSNKL